MKLKLFAYNIFYHESLHVLAGMLTSGLVYSRYQSLVLASVAFAVSILIDADHLTEGFLVHGFRFSWILRYPGKNYFRETGLMTLFFHSWELLPIILLLGRVFHLTQLSITIVLAAAVHYLLDNLVYGSLCGMSWFQYFLFFRLYHRFSFQALKASGHNI